MKYKREEYMGKIRRFLAFSAFVFSFAFGAFTYTDAYAACTECAGNPGVDCSVETVNNQCVYTTSCQEGYKNIQNNGRFNASCSPITFTVVYTSGGGTGNAPDPQTCTYGATNCATPMNPYSNTDGRFTGWECSANSGTCATTVYAEGANINDATTVDGAVLTMSAQWQTGDIILHWIPAYGGVPEDTTCVYGETFDAPVAPEVEGREFNHWTANNRNFESGQANIPCTIDVIGVYVGEVTFNGSFTPISYSITYNMNGGFNHTSNRTSYNIDQLPLTLRNPTRENSSFQGWFETPDFSSSKLTKLVAGTTGNKTLYAKWKCANYYNDDDGDNVCTPNEYAVTYSCGEGGGTVPGATTATYTQTFYSAANTCTHSSKQFAGWLVSGTSVVKPADTPFTWTYTSARTLTAQWVDTPGNCTKGQYYDSGSSSCKTCPSGYTSDLGAENINDCYTTCQTSCIWQEHGTDLPTGGDYVTYQSDVLVNGTKHYGSSTCTTSTICDYALVSCTFDYYFTGDYHYYNSLGERNTNVCVKCPSSHSNSLLYLNENINKCFTNSTYNCVPDLAALTPPMATCELVSTTISGAIYYPNDGSRIEPREDESCSVTNCTCPQGYTYNTVTPACDPNTYEITLNNNGGNGSDRIIYAKYETGFVVTPSDTVTITSITPPTRDDWTFNGYYTAAVGGRIVIDAEGHLPSVNSFSDDTILYAHWSRGIFACTAGMAADGTTACAPGYYCPGGNAPLGSENDEYEGCQRLCPTDNSTGGTVSSASGATAITGCYTTLTSIDLADGTGGGDLVCNYTGTATNGDYTNCKSIAIKYCYGGHYRVSADASTCSKVGTGSWSPDPTNTILDETSMVRYPCSALPGSATNATTNSETSDTPTSCYNTCANSNVTDSSNNIIGVRTANPTTVNFSGSVTSYNPSNASVTATGSYPVCTYDAPVCNSGYHTVGTTCEPNIYTFVINKNGGTGGTDGPIYLKYNTGWYSDAAATIPITTISMPTQGQQNCTGYVKSINSQLIIGGDGKLPTNYTFENNNEYQTAIELVASWVQKQTTTCERGKYYQASTDSCVQCPAGYWCEGGTTFSGDDKDGYDHFKNACPVATELSYTPAKQLNGTTLENVAPNVSSVAGSGYESDCYATVQYTAMKGKGSQVCHYASGRYASECQANTIQILTCDSGYYLASPTGTDCTPVGYQYYSAIHSTLRSRCPDATTASEYISTDGETSEKITNCVRTGVWQNTDHGGRTTRCHYNETDTAYNINCDSYVIRVCDAGYWDALRGEQTSDASADCAAVGVGYYSPEQAYYSSEPARPTETIGSSTSRYACPGSGTTADATSDRITDCYMSCPASLNISHGTTVADSAQVSYNGTSYPACTYSVTCEGGYTPFNNHSAEPACQAHPYTVKYNANKPAAATSEMTGSTSDTSHVVDVASPLAENGYILSGWSFVSWNTNANGSGISYTGGQSVTNLSTDGSDVILYAQWTPKGYDITYSCGTGTGTPPVTDTASYNSPFIVADVGYCTKPGYSFAGWFDGTSTHAAGSTMQWLYSEDKTFTAQWTPNVYKITLNSLDATTPANPSVLYMKYDTGWYTDAAATNAIATLPTLPTKTGYYFKNYTYGNTVVIATTGLFSTNSFVSDNATIVVNWSAGQTTCEPGYYYSGNAALCNLCEEGSYCPGGTFDTDTGLVGGKYACSALTGSITWANSETGATSENACYHVCDNKPVTNGIANPENINEFYPSICSYKTGFSDNKNPCKIENDTCIETACRSIYEMKNGKCEPCARDNATTYEPTGNCIVAQCVNGFHPNGDSCVDDVKDCTAMVPNATIANSTWNTTNKSFGICKVEECEDGYHVASNVCVPDEQVCAVPHGIGIQTWNKITNKWNACEATTCDAGYTNDDSEKNIVAEQCSECYNKYADNGDRAVSSYVRGCEIASCMYQGEKYALEGDKCVPICLADTDETGRRYWDAESEKCVHDCNNGYTRW